MIVKSKAIFAGILLFMGGPLVRAGDCGEISVSSQSPQGLFYWTQKATTAPLTMDVRPKNDLCFYVLDSSPIGGIFSGAFHFNSTVPFAAALDDPLLRQPTNGITLSAWVKREGVSSPWAWVLGKSLDAPGSAASYSIHQYSDRDGTLEGVIASQGVHNTAVSSPIAAGVWHFIALRWTSGGKVTLDIYLEDGAVSQHLEGSDLVSAPIDYSTGSFLIAKDQFSATWPGAVSDVRLYSRALDEYEIQQLIHPFQVVTQLVYGPWEKKSYRFDCRGGFPQRAIKTAKGAWSVIRDTSAFQAMREDNVLMEFPLSQKADICR